MIRGGFSVMIQLVVIAATTSDDSGKYEPPKVKFIKILLQFLQCSVLSSDTGDVVSVNGQTGVW